MGNEKRMFTSSFIVKEEVLPAFTEFVAVKES